ncbi:uncharacterized protein LOC116295388 [Actinia tenebrosa]|uniref:Uncharacterized protein LOC116295388 n=1 Tax=Actinia tenebrosa TaxID=6105 RepID=A0A6P8I2B6_ACTTE|nr:uncharacterized protein LOC116295388 [Actinia tenebrosa]
MFKEEHIHLVPGFPSSGGDFTLVVVFYTLYPLGINVDRTWNSSAVPQNALVNAVRSSQDHISSTFGASIKSIKPYNQTSTSSPPAVKGKNNLIIGLSVGCTFVLLFVIIVISCFFWRKKNHGKFIVKRCVTPIEFVDEKDEIELKKSKNPTPARRRASTLKVVDLDGNIN